MRLVTPEGLHWLFIVTDIIGLIACWAGHFLCTRNRQRDHLYCLFFTVSVCLDVINVFSPSPQKFEFFLSSETAGWLALKGAIIMVLLEDVYTCVVTRKCRFVCDDRSDTE